ncbi:nickel pincer cofactor biosynthesis protein LarC [bacterium]|nr:nickel pincer cofactor biosynthesis protein LarC [bacterium]NIN92882.1 nickel pincer cofactor biosynthesis protein LarC [bacterium]NIO73925.1 nickel pincer cofactor biosynthesis protein LarC [bacterium]
MERVAYFDCNSGISGDMILGAVIDCGADFNYIKKELKKLDLNFKISHQRVKKGAISATRVIIGESGSHPLRNLRTIKGLIEKTSLPEEVKEKSLSIFTRLAEAEANVHQMDINHVHFHEIGAVDTIVDIVGSLLGLKSLKVERIFSSPIPLGKGEVETSHGKIPIPAPATMKLLEGCKVYGKGIEEELVTPTGAAIITSLADDFVDFPTMQTLKVGYGAGTKELPMPNVLRLVLGELEKKEKKNEPPTFLISANIDDSTPEVMGFLFDRLLEMGALDVWEHPILMKKNRLAVELSVLCYKNTMEKIIDCIFSETTTNGLRISEVKRSVLERKIVKVKVLGESIRVKLSFEGKKVLTISPEYEDCRKVALKKGISLKKVLQMAQQKASETTSH